MVRRRRHGNRTPQKTNSSIEDLVENEENEYPVADLSRISMSNEFNEVCKEMLKEKLKKELMEIFMEEFQQKLNESTQKTTQRISRQQIKKNTLPSKAIIQN
jgi:16S rRNA C967 or C1407 C5-methylase (RsmB/RsmF family)